MLTVKQPATYGYTSVHDLPTPPSTSRPSPPPPLPHQDKSLRQLPAFRESRSPASRTMSSSYRGLPPPAAMTLPQQQPTSAVHPPQHPPPLAHQSTPSWTALPAPTDQWQEDSLKNWLQARAEEEKTKQEEEKTRQETLRLEQRKIEADMLQQSLRGGIPPLMVPLVFAGMGGSGLVPQAALDWAQQYINSAQNPNAHPPPLSTRPPSPHHPRDQPAHVQFPGPSSTPALTQAQPYVQHSDSPHRARGKPMGGSVSHFITSSTLPSIGTSFPSGATGSGRSLQTPSGHTEQQDGSSALCFHHWQPPASQSASNRPGTPSGDVPKKRKATGHVSGLSEQRLRSPPSLAQASTSTASRRSHKRQRSDMSWYHPSPAPHERGEDLDQLSRANTPRAQPSRPTSSRARSRSEVGKHSVSSMLSGEPTETGTRPHAWQEIGSPASQYRPGGQGSHMESQGFKDQKR